jgi:cobalt/nickel transport system ATP-binding protein
MLSGGEKKRVAIGSVLTMNPEVLLLDEPTNGLDPRTQSFLIDLLVSLNESGKTIILATHDLNLVTDLDMKVALMSEEHHIEKVGSAVEIISDDDLLLRTNLIHEHRHIHGSRSHQHRHAHVAIHRHDTSAVPEENAHTHK